MRHWEFLVSVRESMLREKNPKDPASTAPGGVVDGALLNGLTLETPSQV